MINHNKIKQLLAHVDRAEDNEIELEYEFEPMTIELFNSEEIEEGQLGYSFDEEGQSLAGNEEGDWKEGWIVIGIDSYLGDPIFVDSNDENYPVYTAMHGEGEWEKECITERIEDVIEKVQGNVG
ncbi:MULTISPECIES: hypothetical protein [Bacillus cereus group]|uniref:Thiamine transporter n=1 Tax=Bacillus cereus TaxID=1396 RepID=A0A2C0EFX1_BACCE|nr:hypothetical protein [Bacillus cereus]PDY80437.1 hypothetical protein CON06_22505 [Bacillus cereus]PFA09167.1 hypothetical protein CN382_23055 [Bacillus cereus]PFM39129.1 hypothetical protein COJ43_15580 [Bacillus cereus]PGL58754.1 hypothetical protein CN927_19735 [Bacillus cereus]PGQ04836.1 hypothetical protein COA08_28585 [Bacillus cereus]